MKSPFALLRYVALGVVGFMGFVVLGVAGAFIYLSPSLPSSEAMRRVELQVPLRIYTRSGQLISQFGEKRLIPVTFDEIPQLVRQAVLAAEDDRFFSHHGVDWVGLGRALWKNVSTANLEGQGGSTITQQAARNMFLSLDKTARRKASEIFVTFRMERDFTKQEILATYLNVVFFGQRSYGIAAAAETFYGKRLDQLSVAEAATLAGIIQQPARANPVSSPQRAQMRRSYVLRRMRELGYIDAATAEKAAREPVASRGFALLYDVEAPYVAERARLDLINRFGEKAANSGYKVFTTIDGRLQTAANRALRLGLIEYDRRHGYRGPLARVALPNPADAAKLDALIGAREAVGILQVAIVTAVDGNTARVHIRGQGTATIEWEGLSWARPVRNGRPGATPKKAADVLAPGDVVHVVTDRQGNALLAQVPDVQGALVALDPQDGAIVSLVGGFDFYANRFDRAIQARRQPASGFKPFLYSAALENGFTPATVVLDAPIVVDDASVEGAWRPENSTKDFLGPLRLREALVKSRNAVSIRVLREIGVDAAIDHAAKFGFERAAMPRNQTIALGTLTASPLQVATGYAVFANGGYKVDPYFVQRIENAAGKVVYSAAPAIVCGTCDAAPAAPIATAAGTGADAGDAPAAQEPKSATMTSVALENQAAAAQRLQAVADRHNAGVPPALAQLASLQGGRGFLPQDRLAPRVISAENAWLMTDMMSDVIRRGTAVRARALNRNDIAGKTGTNDDRDTWFNGFNARLVTTTWVGFDDERSLGAGEEGGRTALPIWMHFMREALRGLPEESRPMPPGLIRLRVSPGTGTQADGDPNAISEVFMLEHLPPVGSGIGGSGGSGGGGDPLF